MPEREADPRDPADRAWLIERATRLAELCEATNPEQAKQNRDFVEELKRWNANATQPSNQ